MKPTTRRPTSLPEREGILPSHLRFPVVGIGASAGGLAALKTFFEQMPADSGVAFVIILHLSPDHESVADKIIQACTSMPVMQVTDTAPIEQNSVYVISPANQRPAPSARAFFRLSIGQARAIRLPAYLLVGVPGVPCLPVGVSQSRHVQWLESIISGAKESQLLAGKVYHT